MNPDGWHRTISWDRYLVRPSATMVCLDMLELLVGCQDVEREGGRASVPLGCAIGRRNHMKRERNGPGMLSSELEAVTPRSSESQSDMVKTIQRYRPRGRVLFQRSWEERGIVLQSDWSPISVDAEIPRTRRWIFRRNDGDGDGLIHRDDWGSIDQEANRRTR